MALGYLAIHCIFNICLSKPFFVVLILNWVPMKELQSKNWVEWGRQKADCVSHGIQQVLSCESLRRAFILMNALCFSPCHIDFHRYWAADGNRCSSIEYEAPAPAYSKLAYWLPRLSDKDFRIPLSQSFLCLLDELRAQAGLGDQITAHPAVKWTLITCLKTFRFSLPGSLCHPEL